MASQHALESTTVDGALPPPGASRWAHGPCSSDDGTVQCRPGVSQRTRPMPWRPCWRWRPCAG